MELIASVSPVRQFLAYLDHIGLDERELPVGHIDKKTRASSLPLQVSARLIVELMDAAAEKTGRPDLGLQFVEWLNPRSFGTLSLASEHCVSLSEWYRLARRYIHLANNAVLYELSHEGDDVALVHNVLPVLRPRAGQFLDALVALSVRTCRAMAGPSWHPVRVEIPAAKSAASTAYQRFFRCALQFESDRHAVIIRRRDFEQRLSLGNPELLAFIQDDLERQALNWSANIEDQVAHVVAAELSGKAPTLSHVASLLAMTPRTLQRHLAECGTDFRTIVKDIRIQIVSDFLARNPKERLAKLAYELGFSEPSAVSRFIRFEMGISVRGSSGKNAL